MPTKYKRRKPIKSKPKERTQALTLGVDHLREIHDMLYAVQTSPKLVHLRARSTTEDVESVERIRSAIQRAIESADGSGSITIEETYQDLSRIPWVINEAAGCKLRHITSNVVSDIYNQIMKGR